MDRDLTCQELVELVTDYLDGALPEAEHTRFEAHVSACEGCELYVEQIRMTIEAGNAAGIEVGMCGEMAGDVRYTRLLLGLGLTEFSMHPANVLEVKRAVREAEVGDLRARIDRVFSASGLDEFERELQALKS